MESRAVLENQDAVLRGKLGELVEEALRLSTLSFDGRDVPSLSLGIDDESKCVILFLSFPLQNFAARRGCVRLALEQWNQTLATRRTDQEMSQQLALLAVERRGELTEQQIVQMALQRLSGTASGLLEA